MTIFEDNGSVRCSFCGKSQDEVRRVIAGPGVYICDECIELCQEIIDDDYLKADGETELKDIPKPQEIAKTPHHRRQTGRGCGAAKEQHHHAGAHRLR